MDIYLSKSNEKTLVIRFKYNMDVVSAIKNIPGRRWVPEDKVWTVPYTLDVIAQLIRFFQNYNIHVDPQLQQECYLLQPLDNKATESDSSFNVPYWSAAQKQSLKDALLVRGYSSKTMKAYFGHVERFFTYITDQRLGWNDHTIQNYSLFLLSKNCSHSYVNQAISAVKFYSLKVLKQHDSTAYIRPKKENKLPNVLSLGEVKLILEALHNLKHKAILYITYSSGLRVSEVVRLRLQDFDKARKTLHIRQGKGRKDD